MKRIIKKSTTITEMIKDDEGKEYIIDRRYNVDVSTEKADRYRFFTSSGEPELWMLEKDEYFREEIAKEMMDYKKKNSTSQTNEKLQTLKFLKESYQAEHSQLPDTSNRKLRIADLIEAFEKALEITNELEKK